MFKTPLTTIWFPLLTIAATVNAAELSVQIVDADSGAALPARVYVEALDHDDAADRWLFVRPYSERGSALPYREQWVPMAGVSERHTTVSKEGFRVQLARGRYRLTVRRGKEYLPHREEFTVGEVDLRRTVKLRRWIDMAAQGWYSGETHVHRRIQELPNVQLAEDLNVSFPVTFWTVKANEPPGLAPSPLRRQGPSPFGPREDRGADMLTIDPTHVIFPRNTEYEIFSIGEQRHVLGAVFILNHQTAFDVGAPPVKPIAERAHREGALLDLDKHSWPWSMMLVPIAKVDLYELANNSLWKTRFGFRRSGNPPAYMNIETDRGGMTEMGWIQYGLQNYYALLNCGFPLKPTAGTASGVHPVPLGFSRVYVYTGETFSGDDWLQGLKLGRSFVTTEPMLLATVNNRLPGETFQAKAGESFTVRGEVTGPHPVDRVEVLVNGEVAATIAGGSQETAAGAFRKTFELDVKIERSSWLAVRTFRVDGERVRFAHTAPWYAMIGQQPLRPRQQEIEFLVDNVRTQIERNREVLSPEALAEFEEALRIYQQIAERAVRDR